MKGIDTVVPRALLSDISTWEFLRTIKKCEKHSPTAHASLCTSLVFVKIPAGLYKSTMHKEQVIYLIVFFILVEASPCTPNPCENNGLCILEQSSFKCNCTPEYEGERCETGKLRNAYVQVRSSVFIN